MGETIWVGIADMNVCKAPDKITTVGLGSCIGIVLYDEVKKIAGLVHIMLPDSTKSKNNQNRLKFADTGIVALIEKLKELGVEQSKLKAKIAGGARMFSFSSSYEMGSIGDKNILAVKEKLQSLNIKIKAEDVGLNYGRTIVFDPENCDMCIIKAGKQMTTI